MHFCRLRKQHVDPTLTLNGKHVPVVEETKFLGLVFDRKLTFVPHLRYLKTKCFNAVNLLRVVAHTSWGGDQQTLLHLYRSLIRSRVDYGCIVHGSTRNSYLRMLEPIHNHALRLCLGALRTFPAYILCAEANEPPLYLRRKRLSLQHAVKISSCFMNPTVECVFNLKSKRLFAQKPTQIAPLGIRIAENLSSIGFSHKNSTLCTVPSVPPWLLRHPCFSYDMYAFDKNSVSAQVLQNHFAETKNCFGKHVEIYTDGSKTGESVACAVICGN